MNKVKIAIAVVLTASIITVVVLWRCQIFIDKYNEVLQMIARAKVI